MAASNPPYTQWSDVDHAGPVIVVTVISLFHWAVAGIGQQVFSVSSGLPYTVADGLFTVSMVVAFGQGVLVLLGASYGLGKSMSESSSVENSSAQRIYAVSNILYILTPGLMKCSATCFAANLTVNNMASLWRASTKYRWYGSVVLAMAWTVGSIVAIAVPCDAYNDSQIRGAMCLGTMARWIGIFVGDAITDLIVAAYGASVIWTTQATLKKRLTWYSPFLVRECLPLWSGLRLLSIDRRKLTDDPLIGLWLFICLSQIHILIVLLGAATPVLKRAMQDIATAFGAQTATRTHSSDNKSFALRYLNLRRSRSNKAWETTGSRGVKKALPFSGPGVGGSALVSRNRHSERVQSDGDSQEGIIQQEEFEVSYHSDREDVAETASGKSS